MNPKQGANLAPPLCESPKEKEKKKGLSVISEENLHKHTLY